MLSDWSCLNSQHVAMGQRNRHMNDAELVGLARRVAGTERMMEKFPNFGNLTDRILALYRERMSALAKAGGLHLLSHARKMVAFD